MYGGGGGGGGLHLTRGLFEQGYALSAVSSFFYVIVSEYVQTGPTILRDVQSGLTILGQHRQAQPRTQRLEDDMLVGFKFTSLQIISGSRVMQGVATLVVHMVHIRAGVAQQPH